MDDVPLPIIDNYDTDDHPSRRPPYSPAYQPALPQAHQPPAGTPYIIPIPASGSQKPPAPPAPPG
eukprot:204054-Pyramimonas_sp.AAC.1